MRINLLFKIFTVIYWDDSNLVQNIGLFQNGVLIVVDSNYNCPKRQK